MRPRRKSVVSEGADGADPSRRPDYIVAPIGHRHTVGSRSPLGESELLTAKDLERWLKIDVKTIYSYVQRGLIPYVRIQSNLRFVRGQIREWIDRQNYRPR